MELAGDIPATTILRAVKMRGIPGSLTADAVSALQRQLWKEENPIESLDFILQGLSQYLERKTLLGSTIDGAIISDVVAELTKNEDDFMQESVQVVSAFRYPKYVFDPARKIYHCEGDSFSLHGSAESKIALSCERFALIHARLMRNETFAPLLSGAKPPPNYSPLSPIDALPSLPPGAPVTLLAMITQPEEGLWCAEDTNKAVAIDLTYAARLPGFYTETSIVLMSGVYEPDATSIGTDGSVEVAEPTPTHAYAHATAPGSPPRGKSHVVASTVTAASGATRRFITLTEGRLPGVFRVNVIAHPPAEAREKVLSAMSAIDPFNVIQTPDEFAKVITLEKSPELSDTMIVICANMHLDVPATMISFRKMLEGFESFGSIPSMFVLMGNFCSKPFGQHPGDRDNFQRRFDDLAELISAYEMVAAKSHFVLIPGPNDPGAARILPRPSIPPFFCERLLDRRIFPNFTLATNPCRIRFFTQELVFFRSDVSNRLQRRAIVTPSPPEYEPYEHMIRTVLDQGHLSPIQMSIQPIYWEYDHSLRLTVPPHALVVGEDRDTYVSEYSGTKVMNPGNFAEDTSFLVYRPCQGEAEKSWITSPEERPSDGASWR